MGWVPHLISYYNYTTFSEFVKGFLDKSVRIHEIFTDYFSMGAKRMRIFGIFSMVA